MPKINVLKKLAMATLLLSATLTAQTPYDEGQKALREHRWMDAAGQFEKATEVDGEQADAAMYWRAYALFKAGRGNEAERELRRLERRHPESRWVQEAQALRIEYEASDESIARIASNEALMNEELRLIALAQLMERDPERALPQVLDLMRNAESENIRHEAMFVLGISEHPEARQAITEAARNSNDPELQRNAIHMLGTLEASLELQSLYPALQDRESKIAVIEALSIAGDAAMMTNILENEVDPDLRAAAIRGIAMDGSPELAVYVASLYATAPSRKEKEAILESLTLMDDSDGLALEILRTEKDPELQKMVIQVLGIMDATDVLAELYDELTEREARIAVLEAMAIADDTEGLLKVLQSEQDAGLRAGAIQSLAITGEQRATEYLLELYPKGTREEKIAVIESLMIMENAEALVSLMKQEDDPELKRHMLRMLTVMDAEASDEYLFELLEKSG